MRESWIFYIIFLSWKKLQNGIASALNLELDDSLLLVHERVQGVVQSVHEVGVMDWRLNT